MKLSELLESSAEARADLAERLTAARAEGRAEVEARIKAASPFLASTAYPKAVTDLALKVVAGEEAQGTLTAAVTMIDAMKEQQATAAAAAGQAVETPAQNHNLRPAGTAAKPEEGVKLNASVDDLIKADKGGV